MNKNWKKKLTEREYNVLREGGTEPPFSGKYLDFDQEGVYRCKACNNKLFSSKHKFKSGTGWPSFYKTIGDDNVISRKDSSKGLDRNEVICSDCNSHLGHVFNDGPKPTNKRYCINSVALEFEDK